MNLRTVFLLLLLCVGLPLVAQEERIVLGDERTDEYFPLLKGKRVAIFSNHTGLVGDKHLLDVLVEAGFDVTAIFSPEHGFRGNADAGEHVSASTDPKTGVPILSLYDGRAQRPSAESMKKFDVLVADIQDVGLRFYTYYISLCRLMDACAEYDIPVVVLDRPNPNGHYVDGPILDMKFRSGVGWLPIPVVHGMTLGELARMANGEGWLPQGRRCRLTVVPCQGYTHVTEYRLPVPPSPNLPDMRSVYLYASLCPFEGTPVSLGRGTAHPFQMYGHPAMKGCSFSFTPHSMPGAKNPPLKDQLCYGVDLSVLSEAEARATGFDLKYVVDAYRRTGLGEDFFRPFFDLLMGTDRVRKLILEGRTADEIRSTWAAEVEAFKERRRPYLLYAEADGTVGGEVRP